MTELAAHLGVEKSSLSGLIERAEKRGLVIRERNALDQRSIDVSLTRLGEDQTVKVTLRARELVLPIVDALTNQERTDLQALLGKALTAAPPPS
jgi:DNA-binding MarR family transcriptional regulator